MGLTMQTLLVAIQTAAPLKDIGAATGLATQARTIGASLGLGVNGGVMAMALHHATAALPASVASAVPGGLAGLTPKGLEALPDSVRELALNAYAHGFAPTYWVAGGLYLAATILLLFLPNNQIPKHQGR
jgi:hypothetical protein